MTSWLMPEPYISGQQHQSFSQTIEFADRPGLLCRRTIAETPFVIEHPTENSLKSATAIEMHRILKARDIPRF